MTRSMNSGTGTHSPEAYALHSEAPGISRQLKVPATAHAADADRKVRPHVRVVRVVVDNRHIPGHPAAGVRRSRYAVDFVTDIHAAPSPYASVKIAPSVGTLLNLTVNVSPIWRVSAAP